MNIWKEAQKVKLNITFECKYEFDISFDDDINREVKKNLTNLMNFIETHYSLKTPLYVEFINKEYIIDKTGKKVGYIFYWDDFKNYPNIYNEEQLPNIELPVNNNKWTVDEILTSFIEALTMYFAWCLNIINDGYNVDNSLVDSILEEYRREYLF